MNAPDKLASDQWGFLTGRRIDDREAEELLADIKGDTGKILAALRRITAERAGSRTAAPSSARSSARASLGPVATPLGRAGAAAARARDAATGRFTAGGQGTTPQAAPAQRQAADTAKAAQAIARTAEQQRRDDKAAARASAQQRGADGRFGAGEGGRDGSGLGGAASALAAGGAAALQGTEQIDPLFGAMGELRNGYQAVQSAISPVGRAAVGMFGRGGAGEEKTQAGWLRRMWRELRLFRREEGKANRDTLRGIKDSGKQTDGNSLLGTILGSLGFLAAAGSSLMAAVVPAVTALLPALLKRFLPAAGLMAIAEFKPALNKLVSEAATYVREQIIEKLPGGKNLVEFFNGLGGVKPAPLKTTAKGLEGAVINAANAAGADPNMVKRIMGAESAGNPTARPLNPDGTPMSSAYGIGQITDGTWLSSMRKWGVTKYGVAAGSTDAEIMAMRDDQKLQAAMMAELVAEAAGVARRAAGKNDAASVYAAYNLGAGEGGKFLRALRADPKTPTADVLSAGAIKNNARLYSGKTVGEAYAVLQARMGGAGKAAGQALAAGAVLPAMPAVGVVASPRVANVPRVAGPAAVQVPPAPPAVDVSAPSRLGRDRPVVVSAPPAPLHQDVSDRGIAHIVTGGIGGGSPHRSR